MVTYKELKDAVKALNALEIEDLNVLRSVGVKRTILEQQFIEEVERVAEANEDLLPDEVVVVFNALIGSDDNAEEPKGKESEEAPEEEPEAPEEEPEEAAEEPEEPEEEEPKPKGTSRKQKPKTQPAAKAKAKIKETTQAKKDSKRSRYNHLQEALSGQLDDMLYDGGTVIEIMDTLDLTRSRVMSHIKHLINDRGLTVSETSGKTLNDTFFKVKEKFWKQE